MKVLIVDDDALIRDSLSIIIGIETDMEVVGTASNGQEAFDMCRMVSPDIVLMDIKMPIMDGVLGTKLIKKTFKDIKVVILTTFKDDEYINQALLLGAEGFILKNQSSENIVDTLRTVARGNAVYQNEIILTLPKMLKIAPKQPITEYHLTEREMDVLKLIGEGLCNKEIAYKLHLTEGTIRNYVTVLLQKLKLRDRTQLAIFYLDHF